MQNAITSLIRALGPLLLALALAAPAMAHEVPARVTVTGFVAPAGDTLTVLLRVPLSALRDFDFPRRGPGYLDIAAAEPMLRDAARLWLADEMAVFADGRPRGAPRLAARRVSLPSNQAFRDYSRALAQVRGPALPADTDLYWQQALLDVEFGYPIADPEAEFALDLRFAQLGEQTVTALQFLPADGAPRVFRYQGNPGRVALDPGWLEATGQFTALGVRHVLGGLDHLLFVICLVLPFRRVRPLVMLVTAFTLAHSLTLAAAALGLTPRGAWFPPLIESLIAASIFYLALENLFAVNLRRRWLSAFGFGLIHGFGFAFALTDSLQFAGSHLIVSLAAFNVGIELGQLAVVALALAALALAFRLGAPRRFALLVLSVLVAHTAWHWLLERGGVLLNYPWSVPELTAAWGADALRWLLLALAAGTLCWLLQGVYRRWADAGTVSAGLLRAPD